jgi:hypothetical protein
VVVIIAAIRLVLLFPALAAGAEDVTARDALRDTRGRFWIIVRTLLAAIVPFLLIGVLLFAAIWQLGLSGRTPPSFGPVALRAVMGGVFALVMNVVAIAVTARLFGWFGDRVKQGSTAA